MARTKKNPAPAPEGQQQEQTAPAVQNPVPEPSQAPEVQKPTPERESPQEPQEVTTDPAPEEQPPEDPDPEPVPAGERPLPYRATVAVSIAVLHKAVGIGTADMLKPVGSLRQGAVVTVTDRSGPFARLKNGLWMKEAFLEVQPIS